MTRRMTGRDARVLIVGGGIGGLSLALSLHAAGIDDIEIFEAAPTVAELGVGINVLPHAVRELVELGLGDRGIGPGGEVDRYLSRMGVGVCAVLVIVVVVTHVRVSRRRWGLG